MILVLFIGYFLVRLSSTLKETNRSISVLTNDADALSKEVEVILSNANELLEDVNQKVETIDPAFQAVADLGTSVSDLNSATRKVTDRFSGNAKKLLVQELLHRLVSLLYLVFGNIIKIKSKPIIDNREENDNG